MMYFAYLFGDGYLNGILTIDYHYSTHYTFNGEEVRGFIGMSSLINQVQNSLSSGVYFNIHTLNRWRL